MRLSIGTRLVIGFLSVVMCLGVTGALTLRGLHTSQATYEKAVAAYCDRAAVGLDMKGLLLDEVRLQKNYLLRGRPEYLEDIRLRRQELEAAGARLLALEAEVPRPEVQRVVAAMDDLHGAFDAAAPLRETEGVQIADRQMAGKAAAAVKALGLLIAQAEAEAATARAAAEKQVSDTERLTLGLTLLVLVFALALALALSLSVTIPLRRLRSEIEALSAGAAPTLNPAIAGRDEVAQIARAFHEAVQKAALLREMEARSRRLEALSSRVARAQDEERERIARELHDGIGQALTAIKLDLSAAGRRIADQPAAATEAIDRANRLVEESLDELRALAFDLRPPALDTLGLVAALRAYAREFERRTGTRTAVIADPMEERLPYAVETALYRICQESLTNAAKHSGAQSVTIRLAQADETISLVITDEGRGFEAESVLGEDGATRGLGLLGMERRAADLGGTFRVESRPGEGTTIKVRVPRTRHDPERET